MVTNSSSNIPTAASNTVLQGQGIGNASAFSTATYPATTTVNQLLYSSATNTVGGLATANSAVLTTSGAGVPVLTALATDGQILIGSTAGAPAAATITAGTGITVTNAANSITIAASGGGGGYVPTLTYIGSQTASTSSALTFTTLSSSYSGFRFYLVNLLCATGSSNVPKIQISTNGGSSYVSTTSYACMSYFSAAASATTPGTFGVSATSVFKNGFECSTYVNTNGAGTVSGWVDVYFANDSNGFVTFSGQTLTGLPGTVSLYGFYTAQANVNALQFAAVTTFTSGTIYQFGIT